MRQWAHDHADDIRPPGTADLAAGYVKAFAAGRMDLALRFTPGGRPANTAKMSLYTVADAVITHEEVFYFDPPPGVGFS